MDGSWIAGRVVAAIGRARGVHGFRISLEQRVHLAALLIALVAPALFGQDIKFDPATTQAQFAEFSRRVAQGIYPTPVQPARVTGLLRFDVGLAATGVPVDTNAPYWRNSVTKDFTTSGYLAVPRLVVSKGFGAGTVTGSYAKVSDSDIKMWGGTLDVPILRGSLVTPELALRAAYGTVSGVNNFELKTYGAEVFISKGFGPVMPYGAVGRVRSDARGIITSTNPTFAPVPPLLDKKDVNRFTAGVRISLLIPKIVVEATKAEVTSYAAKVSIGF